MCTSSVALEQGLQHSQPEILLPMAQLQRRLTGRVGQAPSCVHNAGSGDASLAQALLTADGQRHSRSTVPWQTG